MTPSERILKVKLLAAKIVDRYGETIPDEWQHIRIDLWTRGEKKRGKMAVETHEAELL